MYAKLCRAKTTGISRRLASAIIPAVVGSPPYVSMTSGRYASKQLLEKLDDSLNLAASLGGVTGRVELDDRDGHVVPACVKNPGALLSADRWANLVRLAGGADDVFQADPCLQVELGGAESLAVESGRVQPLEDVEGGDRGAVGEIDDRVGRGE